MSGDLPLRSVDEAVDELLGHARVSKATEDVPLDAALNVCLAEDILSSVDVPPADNSAMDGYALAFKDIEADRIYSVADRIAAGHVGKPLQPGTVARIFTGADIPEGADTVVMQENTLETETGIKIVEPPRQHDNVRSRGQDIASGSVLVRQGDRLTARRLGLVASAGIASVKVMTPLKVAVMSTGDELVEPGEVAGPGQIYNSNRYVLAGILKALGFQVVDCGMVRDTPEATQQALEGAAEVADVVIATGGVSVGEEDHVKAAVEKLGRIDIWKVAIKPGKPLAFGQVRGKPFFGLPGNPVSAFVTFHVLARPFLLTMQGLNRVHSESVICLSDFEFAGGSRREYLRVQLHNQAGATRAALFPNQSSGIMTSVAWADGLAVVDAMQQLLPGDPLEVLLLTGS